MAPFHEIGYQHFQTWQRNLKRLTFLDQSGPFQPTQQLRTDHKCILGHQSTLSFFMNTYFVSFISKRRATGGCAAARLAVAKSYYFKKLAAAGWQLQICMTADVNSGSCPKAPKHITEIRCLLLLSRFTLSKLNIWDTACWEASLKEARAAFSRCGPALGQTCFRKMQSDSDCLELSNFEWWTYPGGLDLQESSICIQH